jgi:hypothetical protein
MLLPIIVLLSGHVSDEPWLLILAIAFTAPALDMIYRGWMFLTVAASGALLIRLLLKPDVVLPTKYPTVPVSARA